MSSNQNIKHYLLSDEEVAKLKARFGQFIMTESGSLYIDLDENTRIKLGGSGGSSTGESYTKEEVDALIAELENELTAITSGLEWKPAVDTYEDIATTYPEPADGWTVNTKDKDETWRYTGTEWVLISANSIPIATVNLDGLLSKEDKARIDSLSTEVLSKISESEDGNLLFNGEEIKGGGSIEVDTELSGSSENPVQNKVIYNELQNLKLNAIKNTKVAYVNHQYKSTNFTEAGTEITYSYTGTAGNLVIAAFMYREETLNKISGFDSWTYLGTSYEKQEIVSGKHDYPQNIDIFYKFVDGTEDTFKYSINLANSWTMSLFVEFKNADTPFWREDLRKELDSQGSTIILDKKTDNCALFGKNAMYFNNNIYSWNISSYTVRQLPAAAEKISARTIFIMDNNENALPFTIVNPVVTDGCGESFYGIEIPAKEIYIEILEEEITDAEIQAAIREDANFVGELPEEEIITEEQINQAIEEDKI